jgi:hypothetical protein
MRPLPPEYLCNFGGASFERAPELEIWLAETFLHETSALHNEDHQHLRSARIGCLWTDADNCAKQVTIAATAEIPRPPTTGGAWGRARWRYQMRGWFGLEAERLDFLLTFSAPLAVMSGDAEFCARMEHELYHCAQKLDEFGSPRFSRETGLPLYTLRDHDFAGFLGVARRYGAVERNVAELARILKDAPALVGDEIARACGVCARAA